MTTTGVAAAAEEGEEEAAPEEVEEEEEAAGQGAGHGQVAVLEAMRSSEARSEACGVRAAVDARRAVALAQASIGGRRDTVVLV